MRLVGSKLARTHTDTECSARPQAHPPRLGTLIHWQRSCLPLPLTGRPLQESLYLRPGWRHPPSPYHERYPHRTPGPLPPQLKGCTGATDRQRARKRSNHHPGRIHLHLERHPALAHSPGHYPPPPPPHTSTIATARIGLWRPPPAAVHPLVINGADLPRHNADNRDPFAGHGFDAVGSTSTDDTGAAGLPDAPPAAAAVDERLLTCTPTTTSNLAIGTNTCTTLMVWRPATSLWIIPMPGALRSSSSPRTSASAALSAPAKPERIRMSVERMMSAHSRRLLHMLLEPAPEWPMLDGRSLACMYLMPPAACRASSAGRQLPPPLASAAGSLRVAPTSTCFQQESNSSASSCTGGTLYTALVL
eukprot:jgi/Ulvmu1/8319/UM042_0025.1